jgi:hypothetical protein
MKHLPQHSSMRDDKHASRQQSQLYRSVTSGHFEEATVWPPITQRLVA